jgi:hypothetical protein
MTGDKKTLRHDQHRDFHMILAAATLPNFDDFRSAGRFLFPLYRAEALLLVTGILRRTSKSNTRRPGYRRQNVDRRNGSGHG